MLHAVHVKISYILNIELHVLCAGPTSFKTKIMFIKMHILLIGGASQHSDPSQHSQIAVVPIQDMQAGEMNNE